MNFESIIRHAVTTPYCQMTAVDGAVLLVFLFPFFIAFLVYLYFKGIR